MKNIIFLGLGAVGATFASQFNDSGQKITVLCDEKRKAKYLEEGFLINESRYDFDYVLPIECESPADIVIISVKYNNLKDSLELIKGLIGRNTIIISLLNGIDSEYIISQKLEIDEPLQAFVSNLDATKEQNKIEFLDKGVIVFGEKSGRITDRVKRLIDLFKSAGISYTVSEDITRDIWWKFMVNTGINQASAVLKAPYWVFQTIPQARELARSAMSEVVMIAKTLNINLCEEDIDKVFESMDTSSPNAKSSTLQDVEAGRKTEVDMFAGKICELGEKNNVPTPINKMFFNIIKSIECMNNLH